MIHSVDETQPFFGKEGKIMMKNMMKKMAEAVKEAMMVWYGENVDVAFLGQM